MMLQFRHQRRHDRQDHNDRHHDRRRWQQHSRPNIPPTLPLQAKASEDEDLNKAARVQRPLGRQDGVYVRPSGAIERGSGFYVPGLEGPKVRLAFGGVLILVLLANHFLSPSSTTSSSFVETLSVFYAGLVLLQGLVQYKRESNKQSMIMTTMVDDDNDNRNLDDGSSPSISTNSNNNYITYQQSWSVSVDDDLDGWKDRVEWATQTFTALTPATDVLLVGRDGVFFSYGRRRRHRGGSRTGTVLAGDDDDYDAARVLADAVTSTIAQSTGGRVALPPTHPVVQMLNAADNNNDETDDDVASTSGSTKRRTVILQRVTAAADTDNDDAGRNANSSLCLVVASDRPLAAFQPTDLEWLGRLAAYLKPEDRHHHEAK
jgi:hypothetical protein